MGKITFGFKIITKVQNKVYWEHFILLKDRVGLLRKSGRLAGARQASNMNSA